MRYAGQQQENFRIKLIDWEDVHSEFKLLEVGHHKTLSDKQVYHFFELKKLKNIEQLDLKSERDLWLTLFNAETEEELEKLVSNGGDFMSQAVKAYHSITATEEFRGLEWLRRKREHDEAQAMYSAEKRGEKRGEERGIKRGEAVGMEKMIVTAIQNFAPQEVIEAMRQSAGITKSRFAELKSSAKKE